MEVVSGAGAPDQPKEPRVTLGKNNSVNLSWEAPINNGALIQEYQLHYAIVKRTVVTIREPEEAEEEDDEEVEEEEEDSQDESDDDEMDEDDDSPDSDDEAETEPNSRSGSRIR